MPEPSALRQEEYREPAMPPELQRAEYRGPATPLALRLEEYRDLSMYLLELMMCWLSRGQEKHALSFYVVVLAKRDFLTALQT